MHTAFLVLLVFVAASCTKESSIPQDIQQAENVQALEAELLQLVNQHRTSQGLSSLAFSQVAYQHANDHTDYMIATGQLNHDNFSARASQISESVNAKSVAENVAKDYATAADALEGWLQSPSHRDTMEGAFSHTAISVKSAPDGTLYFTQLFFLQ